VFVTTTLFNHSVIFESKAGAYPIDCTPLANIRLGWKLLAVTNGLSFDAAALNVTVSMFISQGQLFFGATTFTKITLSIMTLSIKKLSIIIKRLFVKLNTMELDTVCCYSECCDLLFIMLNIIV
jgi:hypothetical protein